MKAPCVTREQYAGFAHIDRASASGSGSGHTTYIRHGGMIVAKNCSVWTNSAFPDCMCRLHLTYQLMCIAISGSHRKSWIEDIWAAQLTDFLGIEDVVQ